MIVMVQMPLPAMEIFEKPAEVAPATKEPLPTGATSAGVEETLHPLVAVVVLEIVIPEGKTSVKLTPDIAVAPGLVMVKVKVEVSPGFMFGGAKDLLIVGLTTLLKRVEVE